MSKKTSNNKRPGIELIGGTGDMTLSVGVCSLPVSLMLKRVKSAAPDLQEYPLERLLWEIAWFARSDSFRKKDQKARVKQVMRFISELTEDPHIEAAWQAHPAGVSRLLTLAVAHFPVSVDDEGLLDNWDWAFFLSDEEAGDDRTERLPRPEEEGQR